MRQNGTSVVTTTWNERENVERLITEIREVFGSYPHEIIVVDDSSPDRTVEVADRLADVAVEKKREGQTKGLLYGMNLAKYSVIVTIDADLENDPRHLPRLVSGIEGFDIVVASRTKLPRISEKIASRTFGKVLGIKDVFSNFRAYRKETVPMFNLKGGETFGAEFLVIAKKKGMKLGEIIYDPSTRRKNPRVGGKVKANLRITWALIKSLAIYLTMKG